MTEEHGGSSFNSNHESEEKWWKNVRCGRLSESSETSPFHPTFFKSDRLRSLQFREKSHASFCYPPSLTGPVCRTKFTFFLRSNSFWRACVHVHVYAETRIVLERFNFVARETSLIYKRDAVLLSGIVFIIMGSITWKWFVIRRMALQEMEWFQEISLFLLFLYFIIRYSLF